MNSTELHAAAVRIESTADQRARWSQESCDPTYRRLYSEVAQQLRDRADQVRSWARLAKLREERGEEYDADVSSQIETATREFLAMAEWSGL